MFPVSNQQELITNASKRYAEAHVERWREALSRCNFEMSHFFPQHTVSHCGSYR